MRHGRASASEGYIATLMGTRPVLYYPGYGGGASTASSSTYREMVLGTKANASNNQPVRGPLQGLGAATANSSQAMYMNGGSASYHPGDVLSIGGWVQPTTSASTVIATNTGDYIILMASSGSQIIFAKQNTGNSYTVSHGKGTGTWFSFLFTKNGSGASNTYVCYINGVAVAGSYSNRTMVAASGNVYFGCTNTGGGGAFLGNLAHISVWPRVLTAAEARMLYLAGRTGLLT